MKIRDRIKELKRIPASELRPNPNNWRTHPEAQRNALRGVLADIGIADVCLVRILDDGSYELVDGHLRAEELQGSTPIPCAVTDLDEEESKKVLLSLDTLAGMADVNAEQLEKLLGDVEFESDAVQKMLDDLAKGAGIDLNIPAGGNTDEDHIPEPPDKPTTKPGDIWILGNHRLMCGDSGDPEMLDKLLAGHVIHLVNTDPPYNVKVEPRSNNAIASASRGLAAPGQQNLLNHQGFDVARHPSKAKATTSKMRAKDRALANDFISDEEFEQKLLSWFSNFARALAPGCSFYLWAGAYPGSGGAKGNYETYPQTLRAVGLKYSQLIIWDKQHPVLTRKDMMGAHESCFYGWKEGKSHRWFGPNNVTDLWQVKKVNPQSMVHLTEKPVELARRAMEYSSQRGENVLDLFGGSGSTLIAAEQLDRHAFLMELDTQYCDVIVKRWSEFTGKMATREGTKKAAGRRKKTTRRKKRTARAS